MSIGISAIIPPEKKRGAICVFNRATYSRCKALILACQKSDFIDLDVIISSSLLREEYGNGKEYIKREVQNLIALDINQHPATFAGSVKTCSEACTRLAEHFSNSNYSFVVVVADRFETLAGAIAASFLNIPLIHIQGGEITGNIDEKIRHAVTKLSDYHFVATKLAKDYLLRMGEEQGSVFNTGCPSLDVIKNARIRRRQDKKRYIICQFNPLTTTPETMFEETKEVFESIREFCIKDHVHCYWYYPNPDPARDEIIRFLDEELPNHSKWFTKMVNQPPEEFLLFLAGCKFMIGNSSCGLRECSYLGVPAINIGERQSIRERSINVLDVIPKKEEIDKAIDSQKRIRSYPRSFLYGDGDASKHILNHLKVLEFSQKGPLNYPLEIFDFQTRHFKEGRLEFHRKRHKPGRGKREDARAEGSSA